MTENTQTLKQSWLVQRLRKPHHFEIKGMPVDNPFSFGGGYKNGGLSEDAMKLLRPIMSFDYMGAAEFEFGEVPKAFNKIANHNSLAAWSMSVGRAKRWMSEGVEELSNTKVYVLAPLAWQPEVESRILEWAVNPSVRMQEPTLLGRALLPKDEWDQDVCGWLELDNGFMFFTDEEMWRKTAELFQAEILA